MYHRFLFLFDLFLTDNYDERLSVYGIGSKILNEDTCVLVFYYL